LVEGFRRPSLRSGRLNPSTKGQLPTLNHLSPFELAPVSFCSRPDTNKDWWLGFIKNNAKDGEPLPYTSKFGLTKKEYDEFLSLGEKRTLEKTGSGTLLVKTNSSGVEFDGDSELAELTGIKINLKELTILTPFALLNNPIRKESPGGPALGAYSGYQWNFEQSDLDKGDETEASFLIGKLNKSGRNFIYFKAGVMKATNSISDVRIVICYDK
jgi:hypothetical protein